jgi:hypothetical protein
MRKLIALFALIGFMSSNLAMAYWPDAGGNSPVKSSKDTKYWPDGGPNGTVKSDKK